MATVVHPFLKDGVEARAYQMRALRSALSSSTLMVMPTGFGKTAVEWMAMAEALRLERGKVLLIAPTTGLVDQQRRMATEMLDIEAESIVTYTGEIQPAKRPPTRVFVVRSDIDTQQDHARTHKHTAPVC